MTPLRRVWLDADPGFDDWVALLMLAVNPQVQWIGMSVVAGNAPLQHTLANALDIRRHYGLKVPIYAGCDKPLIAPPTGLPRITAQNILGENGMRTRAERLPSGPSAPRCCTEMRSNTANASSEPNSSSAARSPRTNRCPSAHSFVAISSGCLSVSRTREGTFDAIRQIMAPAFDDSRHLSTLKQTA